MPRPKHRDGGKFIGEGTYGCTFAPAPKCTNENMLKTKKTVFTTLPNAQSIGKVFANKDDMMDEWKRAQKIAEIDPKGKYFLYNTSSCDVKVKDVQKDKEHHKCSIVSNNVFIDSFPMTKMRNGGDTLIKYIQTARPDISEIIEIFISVFEALKQISSHGIVHHDMKFDNIVYDKKTKSTKIIDFGLVIEKANVYNPAVNWTLNSRYWLHPPEYRMFSELSGLTSMTKDEMRRFIEKNNSILNIRFMNNDKYTLWESYQKIWNYCDYEADFMGILQAFLRKDGVAAGASKYFTKYANKIDIYSVGITLLYISQYIDTSKVNTNTIKVFNDFVASLVNPDPRKRPTHSNAIKTLRSIRTASMHT